MKAGIYKGKAVLEGNRKIEVAKVKGALRVRGDIVIVGGEFDGLTASYSGKLDEKSIRWTKRDLMALGWQGKTLRSLDGDLARANTIADVEIELAHYNDRQWWSVRSIGYVPASKEEVTSDDIDKMDGWFGEAASPAPSNGAGDDIPY